MCQPCSDLSSKREAALRGLHVCEDNFYHWSARIKPQRDKGMGKGERAECAFSFWPTIILCLYLLLEKAKEAHIKKIKDRKQGITFFPCDPKGLQTWLLWTT